MATIASNVMAACTYREAIMALTRGNSVRGLALMNMAAKDGDWRATQFLAASQRNTVVKSGSDTKDDTDLYDIQGAWINPPGLDMAKESIRIKIDID